MRVIKKRRGRPPAEKSVQAICEMTGITRNEAEKLAEKPSWGSLTAERLLEILKEKYTDCDIFNRKVISKTVGYQDHRYFLGDILNNTSTQSCTHLYKFGPDGIFIATAANSARAAGENIKDVIKQKNKSGWTERSKGWKTDPSSGSSK